MRHVRSMIGITSGSAAAVVIGTLTTPALSGGPWLDFVDQTDQRLQAHPSIGKDDTQEKFYVWGDLDRNGWVDLVVIRKQPQFTIGKRRNVLLMNENGVLVDRTAEYASAVKQDELPAGTVDNGFLTPTNDRFAVLADVNGNDWLDLVTAMEMSDGDPKHIGYPRAYVNLGNDGSGNWLGLRFENNRIPQMCSVTGNCDANPRFTVVVAGDVTNNGAPDLYFGDHGNSQPVGHDFDNRLLINDGNGYFADETMLRMGALFNYGGATGLQTYAFSHTGPSAAIGDFNGNGLNDVIKVTAAIQPTHIAIKYNDPSNVGHFINYQVISQTSTYAVGVGDLNNNGRLDLVLADDFVDRYILNLGTNPNGTVNWSTPSLLPGPSGFVSNVIIADLNNDDWNDIIIADVSVEVPGCNRFTNIYGNNQDAPQPSFTNVSSIIPAAARQGVFHVAALDITSNGWNDLVFGRCGGTGIWINIPPVQPCPADLTGDNSVNVFDLLDLLAAWGLNAGHAADLNGDGVVNVFDLLELLAAWGNCP